MSYKKKIINGISYYRTRISIGSTNGKYHYKEILALTIRELENKITEFNNQSFRGINPSAKKIPFNDLADIFLQSKPDIAESTINQYRNLIDKYVVNTIGNKDIRKMVPFDLQNLLNDIQRQGRGKATIKKVKCICQQIFDIAVSNGVIAYNPFSNVKIPKNAREKERTGVSETEQHLINTYWNGHRMGLLALVMLHTGARRGEALALQWKDINLKEGYISISKAVTYGADNNTPILKDSPKTKNGIRKIPISSALKNILMNQKKTSIFVFPDSKGQMMTNQEYKRGWYSFVKYLNFCLADEKGIKESSFDLIPMFTAHQLRHTYTSNLYKSGVKIKEMQYLLGHSDTSITLKIYTHLEEENIKDNVQNYLAESGKKIANF